MRLFFDYTCSCGYFDYDEYLYFVDRKKDVIISGGMNIYPSDIEEIIKEHKSVNDCVVVGIYDNYLGEIPVAILVSNEERKILEKVFHHVQFYQNNLNYYDKDHLDKELAYYIHSQPYPVNAT